MSTSTDAHARWSTLFHQLFDQSVSQVALIDFQGEIIAVNHAWQAFGMANGLQGDYQVVGKNYLNICAAAAATGDATATCAYVGLQEVILTNRPKFTFVYPCHSSTSRSWYRMWVEPQSPQMPAIVVAHKLIREKPVSGLSVRDSSPFNSEETSTLDMACGAMKRLALESLFAPGR